MEVRARGSVIINVAGQKSQDKYNASVDSKKLLERGGLSTPLIRHEEISPLLINYHKTKNFDEKLQKAKEDNLSDYFKVASVSNIILKLHRKNSN